jgi:predicted MPP superfamily phosphohydrolase
MDDPHIGRDAMPPVEGARGALHLGVVHAPYARALSELRDDGADLMFAGHTHGGQVCVPGYGALVTNCDLDRRKVKGLSTWPGARDDAESTWLHVSAGAGTSPFAPVRFACRPEATVLTLMPRD